VGEIVWGTATYRWTCWSACACSCEAISECQKYFRREGLEKGNDGKGEETHREVFRCSIGIGDVPMDEGDAGFKGSLILEINSWGVEDVECDGTALWSCREFCSCAGNG